MMDRNVRPRAPFVSISGEAHVIGIDVGPVKFDLQLGPAQWSSFLRLLESDIPSENDGCAGFLFSACQPLYFRRVAEDTKFQIAGQWATAPKTPASALAGVLKTGWTDPVEIEFGGQRYRLDREYFFMLRDACIRFEKERK